MSQPSPSPTPTPLTGIRDRGVKVIRADPAPAPAPTVTTPAITPAPNKVVTPNRTTPVVAPVIKACARPFQADVTLTDGIKPKPFDKALNKLLAGHAAPVTVDLATPYGSGAEPPAVLVPWLNEIKTSGGSVTVKQYCQGARGMFSDFFRKLFSGNKAEPYKAARDFDAVLQVDALDQKVTQVRFVPRPVAQ